MPGSDNEKDIEMVSDSKEEMTSEAEPNQIETEQKEAISDKDRELLERMSRMEAEMEAEKERLKKERLAFQEERKRFEEEKKAFEEMNVNVAFNKQAEPDKNAQSAVANQKASDMMGKPADKQSAKPEKEGVVTRKGNYNEMSMADDSITLKQADQAAKLKITADMSVLAKKSSREFKKMQAAVDRFDKFMKGMGGRTTFSAEELEKYDKLSHDVYKASDEYLKKKEQDMEKRAPGKDGQKKQSDYEYSRIKAAEEVRESVEQMRKEMLEKAFNDKLEEMNKRCQDQLENLENSRNKMASDKDMDPARRESRLADNMAHTIYYGNCMKQLSSKGELQMKPGESMNAAVNRLNTAIIPTKNEIEEIKAHPVAKRIVDAGVKNLSEGKSFTMNDMEKTMKQAAMKKAPEVKKAKDMKREQERQMEQARQREARQTRRKATEKKAPART